MVLYEHTSTNCTENGLLRGELRVSHQSVTCYPLPRLRYTPHPWLELYGYGVPPLALGKAWLLVYGAPSLLSPGCPEIGIPFLVRSTGVGLVIGSADLLVLEVVVDLVTVRPVLALLLLLLILFLVVLIMDLLPLLGLEVMVTALVSLVALLILLMVLLAAVIRPTLTRNSSRMALLPTVLTTEPHTRQFLCRHLISGLCRFTLCRLTLLPRQLTLQRRLCYPWLSMVSIMWCLRLCKLALLTALLTLLHRRSVLLMTRLCMVLMVPVFPRLLMTPSILLLLIPAGTMAPSVPNRFL